MAAERGIELMVDLMELDADGRARVAAAMPATAVLAAHVPKDAQTDDTDAAALLGDWATGRRLALAGGLGVGDVPAVARWGDVRLIVGSAVTAAADPAAAAARTATPPSPPIANRPYHRRRSNDDHHPASTNWTPCSPRSTVWQHRSTASRWPRPGRCADRGGPDLRHR